jgi:hypothetical protein
MKPSLDRTVKLLWLVIGALLLLFLAIGAVMMLSQVIGNRGAGSEAARVAAAPAAAPAAQPVRYGMPDSIRGTATRIVMVNAGGLTYESRRESYSSSAPARAETNVMFLDDDDGVRLLLDRPAYIRDVSYPKPGEEGAPRAWISYVLALDDTDRSGKLDSPDRVALYVTDLEGRNLRPVLSPPLRYQSHRALGPARILVYALQPPAGAAVDEYRMPQRAFIYDVASGRLAPYAALDSAAERAGRILQRDRR